LELGAQSRIGQIYRAGAEASDELQLCRSYLDRDTLLDQRNRDYDPERRIESYDLTLDTFEWPGSDSNVIAHCKLMRLWIPKMQSSPKDLDFLICDLVRG